MSFRITGVPMVGMEMRLDEQIYTATDVRPYQRADGFNSFVITWRSHCPACAAEFVVTTGTAGGLPLRRCAPCRAQIGNAAVGKNRRAVKVTLTAVVRTAVIETDTGGVSK